jgi:hypothetical protein
MIIFKHRVNTIEEARTIPNDMGVEVDVRDHAGELIITHDPLDQQSTSIVKLKEYLRELNPSVALILNLKTEGIEAKCIEIMQQYPDRLWFFLDMAMPVLVRFAFRTSSVGMQNYGSQNLCVRFSEYEALEYALGFTGKAQWVWIDCFHRLPLTLEIYERLNGAGFKICLVSPELQGHPVEMIRSFREQLKGMQIDAVCTKRPDLWGNKP